LKQERRELIQKLEVESRDVRRHIIKVCGQHGGHMGGALSSADMITALYLHVLNVDPANPKWEERDNFILSRGHGGIGLYAALAKRGFFPIEQIYSYEQLGSKFGTHPSLKIPGVDLSTGSLGHGLSVGVGMAIAGKRDRKSYKVYVMLGDGELQEGSIWEAAMSASFYELDNLVAIVDRNRFQVFDATEKMMAIEPLVDKWKSFGWAVKRIDGNDMEQVVDTLEAIPFEVKKPSAIIADTVKGKGISFLEGKALSHYWEGPPPEEQVKQALEELGGFE